MHSPLLLCSPFLYPSSFNASKTDNDTLPPEGKENSSKLSVLDIFTRKRIIVMAMIYFSSFCTSLGIFIHIFHYTLQMCIKNVYKLVSISMLYLNLHDAFYTLPICSFSLPITILPSSQGGIPSPNSK